jgi:hypothetical protein
VRKMGYVKFRKQVKGKVEGKEEKSEKNRTLITQFSVFLFMFMFMFLSCFVVTH